MKFYTNVSQSKNHILVSGYDNGTRFKEKIKYEPYLFIKTNKTSKYKTIKDEIVDKVNFNSISEARDFIKEYKDVDNFDIYGLDKFLYTFIYDNYKSKRDIEYSVPLISVGNIDIEVSVTAGFPDIQAAENPITLITISKNNIKYVYGCKPFDNKEPNVIYHLCLSEIDLLQKFINKWTELDLDIITGWNVEFFDIPYIINRIVRLLGKEYAQRLSPWGILQNRTVETMGKEQQVYVPVGISTLDYLQLYKKFSYSQQESYKLDHIAQEELGEKKLEFKGTLKDLENNDWDTYVKYNIHDVVLIEKLDQQMKLIDLVLAMAYDAGVTYQDTFTTVNLWDVIIHNYLMDRDTVIPPFKSKTLDRTIAGGYVKDPQVGMHNWVLSFDLTSLYPHIIMQYNISPETYVGKFSEVFTVDDLLNGFMNDTRRQYLIDNNYTVAANMCMFTKDKEGFLPAIMSRMFNDRKRFKDKMLEIKREFEASKDPLLESMIVQYDKLQQAKKIQLNSGYGALANPYFRWFETDYAEAITLSGQLSTRWIENNLNVYLNKTFKTNEDYVIAADTDSVYLKAEKLIGMNTGKLSNSAWLDKVCEEIITPFIAKKYNALGDYMQVYSQKMHMKRECIADRGIFVAKKRYVLNVLNQENVEFVEPKLKIMGIEAIRSSTPHVCRDAIKEAMKITMSKTESDLQKFIANFRERFCNMSFEEVAFPRSVNEMDKWADGATLYKKGTPIHVKGALIFNQLIKKNKLQKEYELIANGQKIKFAYMKVPNPAQSPVLTCPDSIPKELGLDKYIDYDTQFEKAFLSPIVNIIEKIGWSPEEKSTLDKFFG